MVETCCHILSGNHMFGCQASISTFMEKVLMAFPTSSKEKSASNGSMDVSKILSGGNTS